MKKPNLLVRIWMFITSVFSKNNPTGSDVDVTDSKDINDNPVVFDTEAPPVFVPVDFPVLDPVHNSIGDPVDLPVIKPEVVESHKVSTLYRSILLKKLELEIDDKGRILPVPVAGSGKLEQPLTYISHTELLIFLAEWLKHQTNKHVFCSKDLKTLMPQLSMIKGTLSSKQVWRAITKARYRKDILIVGNNDPALYEINYNSEKWSSM